MAINRSMYTSDEAYQRALQAQNKLKKPKTEAQLKGEQMYQEAQQSGQVFNQANGGTGQAVATDTGLQLIEGTESKMKPGDTRMAPGYISDSEIPTSSYEEIGAAQQEADYQTTREAMDALGLGDSPSDYEQYLKAQVESKKMKDESERLALEAQRKDLQTAAGSITAQSDAQQAMAASAIGGPQANTGLRQGWQQAASKQLERLKLDEKQLAIYDEQLKNAQLAGDMELVKQIQLQKDAYTNQAMQNEAQYVQALGDYERNKATITQAGIASFQSLVESGVELDYNTVAGLASQYGLPTDTLMGYYQGAQNIRNDKTLDLAGKELALAQLNQDLQDQMTGMDTQAAKNIKAYVTLVQSGASEDVIAAFKQAAGITDYNDPFTQAELRARTLQNEIAQYEKDNLGKPPPAGSAERLDYDYKQAQLLQLKYEINDLYGNPSGTLTPEQVSEIFTIIPTGKYANGSQFHQGEAGWELGTNTWECAEAYNQITDGPKAGSTYSEKMGITTPGLQTPQVGFGLVLPMGEATGHIETVISVDSVNGTFQTVSWNRNLDGKQTVETYSIDDLKAKEGWGFIESTLKPEYQVGGNSTQSDPFTYQSYYNEALEQNMSEEDAKKYAYDKYTESNAPMTDSQMKVYEAYVGGMTEEETYQSILDSGVTEADLADGINVLTKNIKSDETVTADVINSLGVSDEVQRAMMSELAWIEAVLRKKSGAAITAEEYASYGRMYFPRVGDSEDTLNDKNNRRKVQIDSLWGQMGESGKKAYSLTFGPQSSDQIDLASEEDPYLTDLSTWYADEEENGDIYSYIDEKTNGGGATSTTPTNNSGLSYIEERNPRR